MTERNQPHAHALERDRLELIAEARERIDEILVTEGQTVVADQLLARLDSSLYESQLAQLQAAADGAESLRWAGLLSEEAANTLLNVFWMPPFLALVVAARRREPTAADCASRVTLIWDGSNRRRTPLVLQAATLPLLHFVLLKTGVLDVATTGARETSWPGTVGSARTPTRSNSASCRRVPSRSRLIPAAISSL